MELTAESCVKMVPQRLPGEYALTCRFIAYKLKDRAIIYGCYRSDVLIDDTRVRPPALTSSPSPLVLVKCLKRDGGQLSGQFLRRWRMVPQLAILCLEVSGPSI